MLIDDSENGHLAMDAAVLIKAFEDTLKVLGSTDRSGPATLVADHIIAFAKAGERDPVRLRDLTINAIRNEQRRPPDRLARLDFWLAKRLAIIDSAGLCSDVPLYNVEAM